MWILELTALVNNAGVMVFGEFDWQTEDHMKLQLEVNVLGTMRLTRAFIPLLREQKGGYLNYYSCVLCGHHQMCKPIDTFPKDRLAICHIGWILTIFFLGCMDI
jgi:NAD(P)-dependent dehydrogenase (short-subunit alcohol dehydrogenase family)